MLSLIQECYDVMEQYLSSFGILGLSEPHSHLYNVDNEIDVIDVLCPKINDSKSI